MDVHAPPPDGGPEEDPHQHPRLRGRKRLPEGEALVGGRPGGRRQRRLGLGGVAARPGPDPVGGQPRVLGHVVDDGEAYQDLDARRHGDHDRRRPPPELDHERVEDPRAEDLAPQHEPQQRHGAPPPLGEPLVDGNARAEVDGLDAEDAVRDVAVLHHPDAGRPDEAEEAEHEEGERHLDDALCAEAVNEAAYKLYDDGAADKGGGEEAGCLGVGYGELAHHPLRVEAEEEGLPRRCRHGRHNASKEQRDGVRVVGEEPVEQPDVPGKRVCGGGGKRVGLEVGLVPLALGGHGRVLGLLLQLPVRHQCRLAPRRGHDASRGLSFPRESRIPADDLLL
mmetsp:Transcript_4219/g.10061  ORF Transcript_4219/g.10061 Transcript_4219/m.10061 type:complete len:337 (-) Transcript_4219:4-1014(-)